MLHEWHSLTWEEIGALVENGVDAAILPIGATEQHGPHMGCGMDAELATRACLVAAEKSGAFLCPTLPYGCSIGHSKRWPGTLALQPTTVIAMLKDIGDWLYNSGIRRLFMVNSHVTNEAPLRCALEMLRAEHDELMVALINTATVSPRVRQAHFADADDWHANAAETALMMAVSPHMVRETKLAEADDPDRTNGCVFAHPVNRTSSNGVTGMPTQASKTMGEELFSWLVDDLTEVIQRGMQEQAPLPHSYHHSIGRDLKTSNP